MAPYSPRNLRRFYLGVPGVVQSGLSDFNFYALRGPTACGLKRGLEHCCALDILEIRVTLRKIGFCGMTMVLLYETRLSLRAGFNIEVVPYKVVHSGN
jgi:hypothetical protein